MTRIVTVSAIVAVFAIGACNKKDDNNTSKKPTKTSPTKDPKKPATTPTKPATAATLASVLAAYETIRAALAGDVADVSAHANKLAAAAHNAKVAAAGQPHMTRLASAANALAKASSSDIAAVRKAYGEVSRSAVALLGALPEQAKNYHVFECPMAKGYKRWIQPDSDLKNPYMGKKMLSCGTEIAAGKSADGAPKQEHEPRPVD